jgi:tetratricopeptide (TPR) repeat protein
MALSWNSERAVRQKRQINTFSLASLHRLFDDDVSMNNGLSSSNRRASPLLNAVGSVHFWLLLALILRLLYLFEQQQISPLFHQLSLDEQEAAQSAQTLLSGQPDPVPLYKAPFYSIYLAGVMSLFGNGWLFMTRLFQHLAGVGLVWLTADSARRCIGGTDRHAGKWIPVAAAAFLALYSPLIRLENRLMLDIWTVIFQSGMIWALLRWRPVENTQKKWIVLAGLFGALAWLTRPTLTLVLPFLLVWIVVTAPTRRKLTSAVLFLLPVLLAVAGLGLRNHRVASEPLLLPWQGGYDLWMSNRPEANGRYLVQPGYVASNTANPSFALSQSGFASAIQQGEHPQPEPGQVFGSLNRFWVRKTLSSISERPLQWLGFYLKKALYLVSQEEIFSFESYEVQKRISPLLRWLPPLGFGFIFPLALGSLAWWPGRRSPRFSAFVLLWGYAGFFAGATALYYASGRMRMPLVFPAVLLAAWTLGAVIPAFRSVTGTPTLRKVLCAGLILLGGAASWGDWWGVRSEDHRGREYLRISSAYYAEGNATMALKFAETAGDIDPGHVMLPLYTGQATYALGRHAEAAEAFRTSMQILPEATEAAYNLGVISWYYLEDSEEALKALRVAAAPESASPAVLALASIVSGIHGTPEESGRYLVRARKAAGDAFSVIVEIAETAHLHRRGNDVKARVTRLLKTVPPGQQEMLLDDLRRAGIPVPSSTDPSP